MKADQLDLENLLVLSSTQLYLEVLGVARKQPAGLRMRKAVSKQPAVLPDVGKVP